MIVEIGPKAYIAAALPGETLFFSTEAGGERPEGVNSLPTLASLWRALGRADLEMVVLHPNFSAPWSLRHLSRAIFSRRFLLGRSPLFRAIGPELTRLRRNVPLVVVDFEDLPVINRNNLNLLDRCLVYFKRELPPDYWRVFLRTAHLNLPTPRFRLEARHQAWVAKLRPISIGLPRQSAGLLPPPPQEKQVDVFYSGLIEGSSTLRTRGLGELKALASLGVVVDIPETLLDRETFYRRCAAAWLVWSPEGLGWDCFRHYEALACGSVAMINRPTIERHAPLVHGEHALFYEPEPGGLTQAITAALADRPALQRIAAQGQAHVLQNHTREASARYVVAEARALLGAKPTA